MSELRDDVKFFELESHESDFSSELSQVVFVSLSDFSNESMQAQSFESRRDLVDCFAEILLEIFVAHAADVIFTPKDVFKKGLVFFQEEIVASVIPVVLPDRFRDFVQGLHADGWIIDVREKGQVAFVGVVQEVAKIRVQAVDRLLERGELEHGWAVF